MAGVKEEEMYKSTLNVQVKPRVQWLIYEIMAGVKGEQMYKSTLNVQVKPRVQWLIYEVMCNLVSLGKDVLNL